MRWALGMMLSRMAELQYFGGALIPFADLANHRPDRVSGLEADPGACLHCCLQM